MKKDVAALQGLCIEFAAQVRSFMNTMDEMKAQLQAKPGYIRDLARQKAAHARVEDYWSLPLWMGNSQDNDVEELAKQLEMDATITQRDIDIWNRDYRAEAKQRRARAAA